jgi:glyceraldehyde-3-phosphate dehydrogenase/erythrose-4-phosphate dehydrogenase
VEVEKATTAAEINVAFAERAANGSRVGMFASGEASIVSSGIVQSPFSAIFDAPPTMVIDCTRVNVVAWCDNG